MTRADWTLAVRTLAIAFGVGIVVAGVGGRLLPFSLPLYAEVIERIAPVYRPVSVSLRDAPAGAAFVAQLRLADTLYVGHQRLDPGFGLTVTTPRGHALQAPIAILSIIAAWPGIAWRGRLALIGAALPILVILQAIDIPFVLAGAAQDLLLATFSPQALARDAGVQWMHFLNGGGRLMLALAAAFGLLAAYRRYRCSHAPDTSRCH